MGQPFPGDEEPEQEKKARKSGGDEIEVSFYLNKKILERTIYLTIIIVLLGIIIFLYMNKGATPAETTGNVQLQSVETAPKLENKTNETASVEQVPKTEPEEEPETEPEEEAGEETPSVKTELAADLTFTASGIETDGAYPNIKVTKAEYSIKNTGIEFVARLELMWYDKSDEDSIRDKVRATDEFILKEGQSAKRTMTTFSPKYLSSLNDEEYFLLALYDKTSGDLIDKQLVEYTP